MIEYKINPRFNDTDCLGHINNAIFATWFEEGRKDFFRLFIPSLSPQEWNLIIARIEIDYTAQGHYQHEAVIKSYTEKIGNSSFTLYQECHQAGVLVAKGKVIIVHFNYTTNKAIPIPEEIKEKLQQHFIEN